MVKRNQPARAAAIIGGAALLAGACGSGGAHTEGIVIDDTVIPITAAVGGTPSLASVVAHTWLLGGAMLDAAGTAGAKGNAVVSPSSLATALAMLAEGARGDTLAQIDAALGAEGTDRQLAFAALRGALEPFAGDPAVVQDDELPQTPMVHLAAQIVVDDELSLNPEFNANLARVFDAGTQFADLGSTAGKAILDAWVRHHSGGLIRESAIRPGPDLRLVVQDAIVLAARWQTPFGTAYDAPFAIPEVGDKKVATMGVLTRVAVVEYDGLVAVRLPYLGGDFHADLVLPPVGSDPATISVADLAAATARLNGAEQRFARVTVPQLDIRTSPLDLLGAITASGMTDATGAGLADLSGIGEDARGGKLVLAQAWQQAALLVDEQGTRAAAVTELGVVGVSAPADPEIVVEFNRPFALAIVHAETGWPLFLAQIRDPR